jgi:MFS transporter, DHA3 family, multidrug efflux protein
MKNFYKLLVLLFLNSTTNNFIWFALTYWVYLTTNSVVSTGLIGGGYMIVSSLSAVWIGGLVDRLSKKHLMTVSSIFSLVCYTLGLLVFTLNKPEVFVSLNSPVLWLFCILLLLGVVAGAVYNISSSTLVTLMVKKNVRDRANGMLGTVGGVGFAITSVASGLSMGILGMLPTLIIAIFFTVLSLFFLRIFVHIPHEKLHPHEEKNSKMGFVKIFKEVMKIPGLMALIFFNTFNNLLGGVFMALMDAYGLSMLSVSAWGTLWGVLSLGTIASGVIISKRGLGSDPLRNLFLINIAIWVSCIIFPIQQSVVLLSLGILVWMSLFPYIEATEQTIIQKIVPYNSQGKVFGFAHSVEQSASPLMSFLIGPLTQVFFIPFMSEGGWGARNLGGLLGVGPSRGLAIVFMLAGILGIIIAIVAMRSRQYKRLASSYYGS